MIPCAKDGGITGSYMGAILNRRLKSRVGMVVVFGSPGSDAFLGPITGEWEVTTSCL